MKKTLLFLTFIYPMILIAQESIQGRASMGNQSMYIGDILYLEVEVKAPQSVQVKLPNTPFPIHGLEIYSVPSAVEQTQIANSTITKRRYSYLAFDSITANTGPLEISYTDSLGKEKKFSISGADFQVSRWPVDAQDQARQIEGLIPIESNRNKLLLFGLPLILLAGAAFLFFRKKKKQALYIPEEMDPKVWALNQLQIIEHDIPFENPKASWSHITDVIRLYIEKSWHVPAPYFSTGELLGTISKHPVFNSQLLTFAELFEKADQIKFAKGLSTSKEEQHAIDLAKGIVEFSIPEPEKEEENNE